MQLASDPSRVDPAVARALGIGYQVPMKHELAALLQRRLDVIADHTWRDRDPAAHLLALAEVSEAITVWTKEHRSVLDPRLRHFLANASYAKALDFIAAED